MSVLLFISGCGTGTIQGMVIDDNLTPVSGAVIQTVPPTHSVFSTQNGYTLKNVQTGEYSVTAAKEGFTSSEVKVLVIRDSVTSADIQLKQKVVEEGLF